MSARRGARRGPRPADLPDAGARLGRRGEPAPGRAAAADVQLLVAVDLRACPLRYAFRYVYRMPPPDGRWPRSRSARRPTRRSRRSPGSGASGWRAASRRPRARTWSASSGRAGCRPASATRRPRRATSAASRPCSTTSGTARSAASARRSRRSSTSSWRSTPATAAPPVVIYGEIDRIDRLPSGGIEVIDYKTGKVSQPEGRRREPPAVDLRAGLPRRARPRHARAGDAVLHRVGDAE